MEIILYIIVGAVSGTLAGLFGVGGGLIIVPALVYSLTAQGVPPTVLTHIAVGTSLAVIVFTSINSIIAHQRHAAILWPLVRFITVGVLIGTVLGAITAAYIQGPVLQKIIGVFAIVMALQMALEFKPKASHPPPQAPELISAGGVIGWASAIFGIAGGSLTVPFLLWRSVPIQKAVATSAACGFPIALVGAFSYAATGWSAEGLPAWSSGFVYWPALVGIAATSMFFARVGAKLAHRLNPKRLKQMFSLMLLLIGANFLLG